MADIEITAIGGTSLNGKRYIGISRNDDCAWLAVTALAGYGNDIARKLMDRGIAVFGRRQIDAACNAAAEVSDFPALPIVDGPGWNGGYFALPDGTVFKPPKAQPPIVAFETLLGKCDSAGSLDGWLNGVAKPCVGQPLPIFVIALAFAPPLLRLSGIRANFGFELVGRKGTGKSTLQQLGSSVIGPILSPAYWITFNSTPNAFEQQLAIHNDLAMFVEEAALFLADQPTQRRAAAFQALAFQISNGRDKARFGSPSSADYRVAYLSSSNERLASLTGSNTDTARAAEDRLITLEIPQANSFGVFESVPRYYDSSSEFARSLTKAAEENYGHAMRCYLKHLVKKRADDEEKLRKHIAKLMQKFRERARVDRNDGSAMRVADAFGIIYAAGALARRWRCLPKEWAIGPAILTCYQEYRYQPVPQLTFAERLQAIASAEGTLDLSAASSPKPKAIKNAKVFVWAGRHGRELLVRPTAIELVIPDWRSVRRTDEVRRVSVREAGHAQTKRRLHRDLNPERMFVFRLGEGAD